MDEVCDLICKLEIQLGDNVCGNGGTLDFHSEDVVKDSRGGR